ncbi:MAG: cupin-like domain-containing protein [Oceanicoccus sp.]
MTFDLNGSNASKALDNTDNIFTHSLVDHPLLQMDQIRKLVKRTPKDRIAFSAGEKPESADIGTSHIYHKSEHSLEYAIDNMENVDAYLFIDSPEKDPQFNQLFQDIKVDLDRFCQKNGYRLWEARLFLFVSSPGAITPYHLDHQHTLLAQIKGTKTLNLWPAMNYDLTPPSELEVFCSQITRKFQMREELEKLRKPYEMVPGQGVYIPFLAPHSVKNNDEVSVSLSMIFNTFESQKMWNSFRINHLLRNRLHLSPTLPGTSIWLDEVKHQSVRTLERLARMGWLNVFPEKLE